MNKQTIYISIYKSSLQRLLQYSKSLGIIPEDNNVEQTPDKSQYYLKYESLSPNDKNLLDVFSTKLEGVEIKG